MDSSVISLLIFVFCIVLFIWDKLPMATTAILGCVLMVILGVCDFKTAFGQFSSSTVVLTVGVMVIGAIGIYLLAVFKTSEKNYLSFSAVFNAVWLATIGLAQLRLLGYQKIWNDRTWLNLILAAVIFQISIPLGHLLADKVTDKINFKKCFQEGKIKFEIKEQRLFWI